MKLIAHSLRILLPALLAGVLSCACASAQSGAAPPTSRSTAEPSAAPHTAPVLSESQKAIEADTEKLVQMAADLKVSVDKSNKNEMSLDVIRKAEAVEKLAKSLKERIRAAH